MRSYTLFDEKNATTDWVSEELAEGNCSVSFGSIGKYWAFYSDGRLWEATMFENSRHELRLVNRDNLLRSDITSMMDRLQRLSDSLDELHLEVSWDGKDTLTVRPYYTEEPFTLFEALEKARANGWDYSARIPGYKDIVYCGAGLTAAGRCRFKDALSLPAKMLDDGYTIEVGLESSPKPCLDLAVEMFEEMNIFNLSKEDVLFFRSNK